MTAARRVPKTQEPSKELVVVPFSTGADVTEGVPSATPDSSRKRKREVSPHPFDQVKIHRQVVVTDSSEDEGMAEERAEAEGAEGAGGAATDEVPSVEEAIEDAFRELEAGADQPTADVEEPSVVEEVTEQPFTTVIPEVVVVEDVTAEEAGPSVGPVSAPPPLVHPSGDATSETFRSLETLETARVFPSRSFNFQMASDGQEHGMVSSSSETEKLVEVCGQIFDVLFSSGLAVPFAEMERLQKMLFDFQRRIDLAEEKNRSNVDAIQAIRADLASERESKALIAAENKQLRTQLEASTTELEEFRSAQSDVAQNYQILSEEAAARDAEIIRLTDEKAKLVQDLESQRVEHQEAMASLRAEHQREMEALRVQNQEALKATRSELDQIVAENKSQISGLEERLRDANYFLTRAREDRDQLLKTNESLLASNAAKTTRLKEAALERESLKARYWEDCQKEIRIAAFHAYPDFEWGPVEALLLQHQTHPKEQLLERDQAFALLLQRQEEEDQQQQQSQQPGAEAGPSGA